jgi:hypothetical protein
MKIFVLILWLNGTTGDIEGATKVGRAATTHECQQLAAEKVAENEVEVAAILERGQVMRIACIDASLMVPSKDQSIF